jgi:hypothetical protein
LLEVPAYIQLKLKWLSSRRRKPARHGRT